jgi:hypothetical protein
VTPIAAQAWGPAVCMWMIIAVSLFLAIFSRNAYDYAGELKLTARTGLIMAVLFVWSVLKFTAVTTYIYLGF